MKRLLIILALCGSAFATSISNVVVLPVTSSAWILSRTDAGVGCTIQAAEDDGTGTGNLVPLLADVDTAQFAGSNSDQRPFIAGVQQGGFNTATSIERAFYLGTPVSAQNLSGNYVGRSLRPNWKINYKLTCGSATFTSSFYTLNIAWGIGNEDNIWNYDPTPGTQSYLTQVNDRSLRSTTTYHDPVVGSVLRPVTMAHDVSAAGDGSTYTGKTLATAVGSAWTNPGNILLNTAGTYATYTAGANDILAVCANSGTLTANATDYSTSSIRANIGGHSASGAIVQVAFTETCGGANTPYGNWVNLTLPTSDAVQCLPTCSAITPIDTSWGTPPPLTKDIRATANTGFLFRTTGTDVNLYQAKVDFNEDDNFQFFAEGSQMSCAPSGLVANSTRPGTLCLVQVAAASTAMAAYWFDLGAGAAGGAPKYICSLKVDTSHMISNSGVTLGAGKNFIIGLAGGSWDWSKLAVYSTNTDSVTGAVYAIEGDPPASGSAQYDNDNAPDTQCDQAHGWTWTNLTPNPNDLQTQAAAFNGAFSPTNYKLGLYSVAGDNSLMLVGPWQGGSGTQNIAGWDGSFKPGTGFTGLTFVTGDTGATGKVRWCGVHSQVINNINSSFSVGGIAGPFQIEETHSLDGSSQGQGPYQLTLSSCATGTTDCPAGTLLAGNSGDIVTLNLSGQPTSAQIPTSLQNIAVNDVFEFGTAATGEFGAISSIVTTSPLQVTVYRGVNGCPSGGCPTHANASTIKMTCNAGNTQAQMNGSHFYHYSDDPTGVNPIVDVGQAPIAPFAAQLGSTVTGNHQDLKFRLGDLFAYRAGSGYHACHELDFIHCPNSFDWSPDSKILNGPAPACGGGCGQAHPAVSHEFLGPASDFTTGHDARPFSNGPGTSFNRTYTQVASCSAGCPGSLYVSNPTSFAIGSGLTSIVVSNNVATINTGSNPLGTCPEVIVTGSSTAALNGFYVCGTEQNTTTSTIPTSGVADGTYNNAGLTVVFTTLHHEWLSTLAFAGNTPFTDVSGSGAVITGNSSDNFKMCVVHFPGDCVPGSTPGQIYVNMPATPTGSANYNGFPNSYAAGEITLGNQVAYTHSVVSLRWDRDQTTAQSNVRIITHPPALFHTWSLGAVSTSLPARDGNGCLWLMFQAERRERIDVWEACEPAIAADDTINRQFGFVPFSVTLPSAGVPHGAAKWDAKFGYDAAFDCLGWTAECHSISSTIDVNHPFYVFGDVFTLRAVANPLIIPVRPRQLFMYEKCYYDNSNNPLGCGAMEYGRVP